VSSLMPIENYVRQGIDDLHVVWDNCPIVMQDGIFSFAE
jgi:hypothetical protein